MTDLIRKSGWSHNENKRIKLSRYLVYFFVLLGAVDGALLLDFSSELIIFTATLSILYLALTIFLGWLMLRAISKKGKSAYVIPAIIFLLSLTVFVPISGELEISENLIIPILELTMLTSIFFLMRGNYLMFARREL